MFFLQHKKQRKTPQVGSNLPQKTCYFLGTSTFIPRLTTCASFFCSKFPGCPWHQRSSKCCVWLCQDLRPSSNDLARHARLLLEKKFIAAKCWRMSMFYVENILWKNTHQVYQPPQIFKKLKMIEITNLGWHKNRTCWVVKKIRNHQPDAVPWNLSKRQRKAWKSDGLQARTPFVSCGKWYCNLLEKYIAAKNGRSWVM